MTEAQPAHHRVPIGGEELAAARGAGEIYSGDLGSFPSDHASFYMTLSAGIWAASRRAGLVALAWTLFVTLGSRMVTGQHSLLDIAVGSAIGVAILLLCRAAVDAWGKRLTEPMGRWSLKHPGWSAGLAFLIAFETSNTLADIKDIKGFAEAAYADLRSETRS
ncbi:MAG: phosphatase PAP2 family protein [Pseudomonadota bacterium]|nr:phosphatase PAP2 family protein [Pseudomonadota bacterium]